MPSVAENIIALDVLPGAQDVAAAMTPIAEAQSDTSSTTESRQMSTPIPGTKLDSYLEQAGSPHIAASSSSRREDPSGIREQHGHQRQRSASPQDVSRSRELVDRSAKKNPMRQTVTDCMTDKRDRLRRTRSTATPSRMLHESSFPTKIVGRSTQGAPPLSVTPMSSKVPLIRA